MGKIAGYSKQTPSIKDFVIGTDGDETNNKTYNYSIEDLVNLFIENVDIEGITQNNKVVRKDLSVIDPSSNIADAVNATPEFQIGEQDIFVFTCSKYITNSGGGAQRIPGTPVDTDIYHYRYLFTRGKGYYGQSISNPTVPVEINDFIEIEQIVHKLPSSTDQDPVIYTIPNVSGLSAVNAINTSGTYAIMSGKDVYFIIGNVNGNGIQISYGFVGASGTYGIGATSVVSADILTIEEMGIKPTPTTSIRVVESIPLFVPNGSSMSAVINALPPFSVAENQLYIFNFARQVTSGGNVYIETSSWFSKKGKGAFGGGGAGSINIFTERDLKLNFRDKTTYTDSNKDVEYYNLDQSDESDVIDAINASTTPIVVTTPKTTVINKDDVDYKFIGANGSYGDGLLQAVLADIEVMVSQPTELLDYETTTQLDARDTANRDRSNHTGTQLADTISDFSTQVAAIAGKNPYATIATMLAGQANQNTNQDIVVDDAVADTNIIFEGGETKRQALYRYKGVANGLITDYTLLSVPYGNKTTSTTLIEVTINLGAWDMTSTFNLLVPHGLGAAEWKTIKIKALEIRNDADDLYVTPYRDINILKDATNMDIQRVASDMFDSTDYNNGGAYNRGWITFTYVQAV